jgi:MFS family permease
MEARDRRNATFFVIGEALWGFSASLVSSATVLSTCLIHFGATERMVGAISMVDLAGILLPQVIGVYLFASRRRRQWRLIVWHLVFMIPFLWVAGLLILLGPRPAPEWLRWGLLACWGCFVLNIGLVLAAWSDWVAHLFAVGIRGTVFGTAMCASAASGTLGGLLAGWLLSRLPVPDVYGYLYLASGVFACFSILTFGFVEDPARLNAQDETVPRIKDLLGRFRLSLADRNFRAFLVARILSSAGFCMVPLVAAYYASEAGGGLSSSRVVSYGAALTAGSALSNLTLGRLGDRYGHRLGLLIGSGAQIAALSVLLLGHGEVSCLLTYFCAGVCVGSSLVSHANMMYETCPHDLRIAHLTVGSLVLGTFTSFLPLLAGAAAARWGLPPVFGAGLAFSVAAMAWLLLKVREPRYVLLQSAPD